MPASSTSPPTKQTYNALCHVLTTAHVCDEDDIDEGKVFDRLGNFDQNTQAAHLFQNHSTALQQAEGLRQSLVEVFLPHTFIPFVLPASGPNI